MKGIRISWPKLLAEHPSTICNQSNGLLRRSQESGNSTDWQSGKHPLPYKTKEVLKTSLTTRSSMMYWSEYLSRIPRLKLGTQLLGDKGKSWTIDLQQHQFHWHSSKISPLSSVATATRCLRTDNTDHRHSNWEHNHHTKHFVTLVYDIFFHFFS